MKKHWLYIIFFLFTNLSAQEPSGDLLSFDRLGQSDVKIHAEEEISQQVLSASRTLQSVDELPFTIYVVTREEIFKNNHTTLVDVLKTVPGIRVSQPGSALEGETFVMRGLLGNGYTKILVNDLPVKPFVVSGMPIGAQLPIKEAERIEIIFGPGASIYGADASAGVINIITSQTERPIYAQADWGIGSKQYNHLSVMFGGKVGQGKRILKFAVYGSTTEFDTWDLDSYYPGSVYEPSRYRESQADTSYLSNPNYRGSLNNTFINDLPHLSKSLGVHLKYRAFNLSFSKMYRRDHSALGLNPLAVSSADPSTFTGETINTFNIGFSKKKPKWGMNTNINFVGYRMDNNSSAIYIDNSLSRVLKFYVNTIFSQSPEIRDTLNNENFNNFFSGRRYQYASSDDLRLEQLVNIRPVKNLEVVMGLNLTLNYNQPQINYLNSPSAANRIASNGPNGFVGGPIFVDDNFGGSLGLFTQLYLTLEKLNIIAGIRYDSFSDFGKTTNPRIALLYKLSPRLSAYGSVATAFRAPSPFYGANTYLVRSTALLNFTTNPLSVLPEKTRSADLGLRLRVNKKINADLNFFVSRTNNFISPFSRIDFSNPQEVLAFIGYSNDSLSETLLYGTQINVRLDDLWPARDLKIEANLNLSRGREILPFDGGRLENVRMQPPVSGQVLTSFRLVRRFYVHLNGFFSDFWVNRNDVDGSRERVSPEYFNMDFMGRLQLTESFNAFFKINNLFDATYGGIGATGTSDDLILNPQQGTTFRLGMSYRMQ